MFFLDRPYLLERLAAYMGIGEDDEDIYSLEIPEAKKRYILDQLNPLLEELVTQVMIDLPPKPAEFTEPDLWPGVGIACLLRQTLESSFSTVSKLIFANKS